MSDVCKIRPDGSAMAAPNPLRIVISNPSDERYRYEGWLEKLYTEPPVYDTDTQYLTDHWVQDGQYAVQVWTVHDIPAPDTTDTID